MLTETSVLNSLRAEKILSELQPHVVSVRGTVSVSQNVLHSRRYGEMRALQCIRKLLAVLHGLGGLTSVSITGAYIYYGAVGSDLFGPTSKGVIPVVGMAMVVGIHTLNACACFSVAYSLWRSTQWGRLLVFFYDGVIFLIFFGLLVFSLSGPSPQFSRSFLWFNVFVLLVSGFTVVLCFRPFRQVSEGGKSAQTEN